MSVLLASLMIGWACRSAASGPARRRARETHRPQRALLREWLGGLAAAGYLTYDTEAAVRCRPSMVPLAQEGGPMFVGGMLQQLPALVGVFDDVAGVQDRRRRAQAIAPVWTASSVSGGLVRESIVARGCACPTCEHTERGADVADVGCGAAALIKPRARSRARGTSASTTSARRSNALTRPRAKPASASSCGSKNATFRKGCRASIT